MEENNRYGGQSAPRVENSARQRAEAAEYLRREAESRRETDELSRRERDAGEARMREHADLLARAEARAAEAANGRRGAAPGARAQAQRSRSAYEIKETTAGKYTDPRGNASYNVPNYAEPRGDAEYRAPGYADAKNGDQSSVQEYSEIRNAAAPTGEKINETENREAASWRDEYEPITRNTPRHAPRAVVLPENAKKDEKSDTPPTCDDKKDMLDSEIEPNEESGALVLSEQEQALMLEQERQLVESAKATLRGKLRGYERQMDVLRKRMRKLDDFSDTENEEENLFLTVKRLGVQKELVDIVAEALAACVYAEHKGKTAKYKKLLMMEVETYNRLSESYEELAGKPAPHIPYSAVDDVIEGKKFYSIANVYYLNDDGTRDDVMLDRREIKEENRRRLEREDQLVAEELARVDEEYEDLTREETEDSERRHAERTSAIRRAIERDVLMIGLRNEYSIAHLEAERDMLNNSFAFDEWKKSKEKKSLTRKITKLKNSGARAISREREDNERYYMLSLMEEGEQTVKKRANREKLDELKMRLEVLLSEREDINERLIALYGGTDKNLKKLKIDRKATKVRKKHAKAMYRRQRHLAAKIAKYDAPWDTKEKAFDLLNKKTRSVALLEESNYKLRHLRPEGRARTELLGNIKHAKADIKSAESGLKFIMKKLKRNHRRKSGSGSGAAALFGLIVIAIAVGLVIYFFGDKIGEYFKPLLDAIDGR